MAAGLRDWGLLGAFLILCTCIGILCEDITALTAREGESVEFKCNYDFPNARVEWRFISGSDTVLIYYEGVVVGIYKGRVDYYNHGIRLNQVTRKDSGEYICDASLLEPSGAVKYSSTKSQLVVLVPPSVPTAQVPTSASTGSLAILNCIENDGSPPPTFTWYRNNVLMPTDPKTSPSFQNTSYTLNPTTGQLRFDQVMKSDIGEYSCEATNSQGKQKSAAIRMEVNDVNVGGIVAAVIVSLLILALIAFAVWFAYRRGYIGKKSNKKVIYSQPSETRSDKNFQQTSSFLV